MKNIFIRYLREHPLLLFTGIAGLTIVTFLLTLIPSDYMVVSSRIFSYDKLGHIFLFGSWTLTVGLYRFINHPKTKVWSIFVVGVLFGGLIELLQMLLPVNREAELLDLGCDALGSLAAALLLKYLFKSSR